MLELRKRNVIAAPPEQLLLKRRPGARLGSALVETAPWGKQRGEQGSGFAVASGSSPLEPWRYKPGGANAARPQSPAPPGASCCRHTRWFCEPRRDSSFSRHLS